MKDQNAFYTMKGYLLQEHHALSSAKEDYLEMITRLAQNEADIRVNELAARLHVKASSVTKMVQLLTYEGYLQSEKYGLIYLTEKGLAAGKYLLYRHAVLQNFLCTLNQTASELEQVEKIEHFLDERTVKNLELLTEQLQNGISQRDSHGRCSP